ncbi:hypothetical protein ATO6_08445 [Oceanicola sp. 22II-s10i]|uniref:AraC family transcriptional regulator n=1 Tax=Oceanicola sp. 22II-s10i TaxID=1317116 RepID=UPI000B522E11|nr:AraC family transcriptional regulator [Oceanicola sp. 22II-s10i]OWU85074.1 hypothetical protein ATO6_08445 [Oceanicola sp. 22II-s10i]
MSAPAFVIHRDFAPAPPQPFRMDRHYLLYAARGAMRLEAEGRTWSLPPARAALIAADHAITVELPQPLTALSVLFAPEATPQPPATLSVFDISPLARALLTALRDRTDPEAPGDPRSDALFAALTQEVWHLARAPSPAHMPSGHSPMIRRALALTAVALEDPPSFDALAATLAVTPRTLARRFASEIGMPWRAALRRMRMIRAIELLAENDASITEVALAVGYASLSAFTSAFRDMTGQSPAEYRRSFRQDL